MGYAGPQPTRPNTTGGAVYTPGRVQPVQANTGAATSGSVYTRNGPRGSGGVLVVEKPKTKKEKLQADLAQAELKLKWLTNNLVPYYGYDSGGDFLLTTPYTKYRKTYYFIRVDGKNKNGQFKYFKKISPWVDNSFVYNPFEVNNVHTLADINKLKSEYKSSITSLKNQIAALSPTNTKVKKVDVKEKPKDTVSTKPKKPTLIYNVSAPKDAYFSAERRANLTLLGKDGNQPKKDIVDPYLELWKDASNHKGMISSWVNPNSTSTVSTKNMVGSTNFKVDTNRYAFQFQYNPQPITMSYAGAPPVDIANFTSGQEEYALYTGGSGSGAISFDLIINRIDDMKYYTSPGKLITKSDGTDVYPTRQPYGANDPESKTLFNEQEFIYNKGTMYDVEFLLRTVMGVTMQSKFRGKTADFGWIGAMPIELHLSPGLRYWANLSAFTVNHVLFNERMVPIFSTVKINCNRLPDYAVTVKQQNDTAAKTTNQKALAAGARGRVV